MDAPTGEQPMDVLGATNTLHRVSTEHLLPHRSAVTCVFPSARAREPFYATFSFVSRCHAVGVCVCVSRSRSRMYVCTCVYIQSAPPSTPHPLVHPDDDGARANLERRSLDAFVLFATFRILFCGSRARVSPSSSSPCLFPSLSAVFSPASHPRLLVPASSSTTFLTVSLAMQPARFPCPRCPPRARGTPSDFRTPPCTYRVAGLQRNTRGREPNERAPVRQSAFIDSRPLFLRARFFVHAGMCIAASPTRDSFAFSAERCVRTTREIIARMSSGN